MCFTTGQSIQHKMIFIFFIVFLPAARLQDPSNHHPPPNPDRPDPPYPQYTYPNPDPGLEDPRVLQDPQYPYPDPDPDLYPGPNLQDPNHIPDRPDHPYPLYPPYAYPNPDPEDPRVRVLQETLDPQNPYPNPVHYPDPNPQDPLDPPNPEYPDRPYPPYTYPPPHPDSLDPPYTYPNPNPDPEDPGVRVLQDPLDPQYPYPDPDHYPDPNPQDPLDPPNPDRPYPPYTYPPPHPDSLDPPYTYPNPNPDPEDPGVRVLQDPLDPQYPYPDPDHYPDPNHQDPLDPPNPDSQYPPYTYPPPNPDRLDPPYSYPNPDPDPEDPRDRVPQDPQNPYPNPDHYTDPNLLYPPYTYPNPDPDQDPEDPRIRVLQDPLDPSYAYPNPDLLDRLDPPYTYPPPNPNPDRLDPPYTYPNPDHPDRPYPPYAYPNPEDPRVRVLQDPLDPQYPYPDQDQYADPNPQDPLHPPTQDRTDHPYPAYTYPPPSPDHLDPPYSYPNPDPDPVDPRVRVLQDPLDPQNPYPNPDPNPQDPLDPPNPDRPYPPYTYPPPSPDRLDPPYSYPNPDPDPEDPRVRVLQDPLDPQYPYPDPDHYADPNPQDPLHPPTPDRPDHPYPAYTYPPPNPDRLDPPYSYPNPDPEDPRVRVLQEPQYPYPYPDPYQDPNLQDALDTLNRNPDRPDPPYSYPNPGPDPEDPRVRVLQEPQYPYPDPDPYQDPNLQDALDTPNRNPDHPDPPYSYPNPDPDPEDPRVRVLQEPQYPYPDPDPYQDPNLQDALDTPNHNPDRPDPPYSYPNPDPDPEEPRVRVLQEPQYPYPDPDPYQDPNLQDALDTPNHNPDHPDPPYSYPNPDPDLEDPRVRVLQDPLNSPNPNPDRPGPLDIQCPGGSCNPALGDLMLGREGQLSASSTCGLDGPQNYCIIGYLEEEQKCFTCDSRQPYDRYSNPNSHRIDNVITTFDPERKMKWWQSENGVHQVSIRLDLETVFQFSHMVLTFKSFRPAAMLVERSKDFGRTWKVFRYFAEDCSLYFPSVSDRHADSIDDVVCDSRYSGSEPSTDGEVVLKALDPIFHIENPYAPNIQDLITLTNIRVNFTRLFTLGDTLGRKRRNPQEKYYYSLYNMVVRGSCFCNGHAEQCRPVDPGRGDVFTVDNMVHGRCMCHHNTAGENCERCQDFHSDSPWRPGGGDTAHICRRCNCHGHSDSCHFDAALYEASGGRSGGVCDDCRHDRTGPQCERCRPGLFQDPQRATDDPNACIPCDCDPSGSHGGGLCDPLTGRCDCKDNVDGERCDRCKHGFYNLRADDPAGCQVCRCHPLGSVGSCDQQTGSCQCERLARGPLCDQCLAGFWGLGNSGSRCLPCDCDIGGAQGNTCSPVDGQCQCLPNMIGRRCSSPAPGYFLPALDYFLYEAELAAPLYGGRQPYHPHTDTTHTPETHPPSPYIPIPDTPPPYPYIPSPETYPPSPYIPNPETYPPSPYVPIPETYPAYPYVPSPETYPPSPYIPNPETYPPYPYVPSPDTPPPYPYIPIPDTYPPSPYVPIPETYPPPPYIPIPATQQPSSLLSLLPQCEHFLREQGYDVIKDVTGRAVLVRRTRRRRRRQGQLNPGLLPQCERFLREQGYDVTNDVTGRALLIRKTRRRPRRQGQQSGIPLEAGQALQIIPRHRTAGQPVTWTGLGLVRVLSGAGLRFTVDNLPASTEYRLVIRYEPEAPCDWLATVSITTVLPGDGRCSSDTTGSKTVTLSGNSRGAVLDSPLCLNAGGRYFVDIVFDKPAGSDVAHVLIDSMGLIPSTESVTDFCSQNDLDAFRRFRCVGLAAEPNPNPEQPLPDVCEELGMSMSARVHNGAVPCRCNADGSVGQSCSKVGGICECEPNVIGRCCDTCAPLTFGFGPDGCKPCECDPRGSVSAPCDQLSGQCECRDDVTGRRCDRCRNGFWDFPSCRPCECNGLSELCDAETGECLNCRDNAAGPRCDRCVDGYQPNPVSCDPCSCPELRDSGRFFATSCSHDPESFTLTCSCLEGHTGPRCDRCGPGYYGNLALLGASCEPCPCSNNIAPDDRDACDAVTGRCLRCLHDTAGPQCQECKAGYYGNALNQDCKECSCDRRGTEVTRCPLGGPCFCERLTGQCPCRTGAVGLLCDMCEDEYWNIEGAAGCIACNCDPTNALSNVCDKVTGQCPCRPEFGGRQCDECGENHFGNPELQCISCDCNMAGTERPSCNPQTGECLCRRGVSGMFCEECALGYDSSFPECEKCSPCYDMWARNITDVKRAAETMTTLIPRHGDQLSPEQRRKRTRMLDMWQKMAALSNLTAQSPLELLLVEKMFAKVEKLKDSIDPNMIIIDPSALLNSDINNVRLEVQKLLNLVTQKLEEIEEDDEEGDEDPEELLAEIVKLNKSFMLDEKKVKEGNRAVEDSMDMRQEIKRRLILCSSSSSNSSSSSSNNGGGELEPLEKKVKELSVVDINKKVCGQPGLAECSGCGGALCVDLGKRKCGGLNCDGALPLSQKASDIAEKAKDQLADLPLRLEDSKNKILDAKRAAQVTKDQAKDLQDRINGDMKTFESEKNKTKELIKRVRDYLMDEMVPPEHIEKMARAVLNIQLPVSPDQIRSMIDDITNLLADASRFKDGLKDLEGPTQTAKELLKKALEIKERTKNIDVTGITRDIYEAEKSQEKANDNLEASSANQDTIKDSVQKMEDKLVALETKLMKPIDLQDEIKALKKKTDQNREAAREAVRTADTALTNIAETKPDVDEVLKQYELLKQKASGKEGQGDAAKKLKEIMEEVENMRRDLDGKQTLIQDLEEKIQKLLKRKEDKANEVDSLLEEAEALRKHISEQAERYAQCG